MADFCTVKNRWIWQHFTVTKGRNGPFLPYWRTRPEKRAKDLTLELLTAHPHRSFEPMSCGGISKKIKFSQIQKIYSGKLRHVPIFGYTLTPGLSWAKSLRKVRRLRRQSHTMWRHRKFSSRAAWAPYKSKFSYFGTYLYCKNGQTG